MLSNRKKKLIRQIVNADEERVSVHVVTVLRNHVCHVCVKLGRKNTRHKIVRSHVALGMDVCAEHSALIERLDKYANLQDA